MRRIVITENIVGTRSQFVAETSAGARAVSSTLEGALTKLWLGDPPVIADELHGFARIFRAIRPTPQSGQISRGQASG